MEDENELVVQAVTHAANIIRSRRCPCRTQDEISGQEKRGPFNLSIPSCDHHQNEPYTRQTIEQGLIVDVVLQDGLGMEDLVLERWMLKIEEPSDAETGTSDGSSSLYSAGSAQGRAGPGKVAQMFRKAAILLRSFYSLTLALPANRLFHENDLKGLLQGLKLKTFAMPHDSGNILKLDRQSMRVKYHLKPVSTQGSVLKFSVNYLNDMDAVKAFLFRSTGSVKQGQSNLAQALNAQSAGFPTLNETEAFDHSMTGAFLGHEEDQERGEIEEEEDDDEEEGELEQFERSELRRAVSGPRAIPINRRRVGQSSTGGGSSSGGRSMMPIRAHSQGQHPYSMPVGRREPTFIRKRSTHHQGSLESPSPFRLSATPPLHPSSMMRRPSSASSKEDSNPASIFAFATEDSFDSLTHHAMLMPHNYSPSSLPTRLITLPSGNMYRSPSDTSLPSLMNASIASSIQLFHGGGTNTPPFAVYSSASKTMTSSSMSSTSTAKMAMKQHAPSFSTLTDALVSNPPLQGPLFEQEVVFTMEDGPNMIRPFKVTGSKIVATLNKKSLTTADIPLEMPWFIPEDTIKTMTAQLYEEVKRFQGSTSQSLHSPFHMDEDPSMEDGDDQDLNKFINLMSSLETDYFLRQSSQPAPKLTTETLQKRLEHLQLQRRLIFA